MNLIEQKVILIKQRVILIPQKNNFDWADTWSKYDYPKAYQRQLEMYQWVFRKEGYKVSNEGFLLYFNGLKNEPMFNQEMKFEHYLIKLDCNDEWVEEV